jgi:GT2 family glycosyltransferase
MPDDTAHLSGAVAHGRNPFGRVSAYGPVPAECELLDGVFLAAARRSVLLARGVHFDSRFEFHFYDLDFCRSARAAGLRLGTWPICLTHQSTGAYESPAWLDGYNKYLEKWGD